MYSSPRMESRHLCFQYSGSISAKSTLISKIANLASIVTNFLRLKVRITNPTKYSGSWPSITYSKVSSNHRKAKRWKSSFLIGWTYTQTDWTNSFYFFPYDPPFSRENTIIYNFIEIIFYWEVLIFDIFPFVLSHPFLPLHQSFANALNSLIQQGITIISLMTCEMLSHNCAILCAQMVNQFQMCFWMCQVCSYAKL